MELLPAMIGWPGRGHEVSNVQTMANLPPTRSAAAEVIQAAAVQWERIVFPPVTVVEPDETLPLAAAVPCLSTFLVCSYLNA